MGKKLIIKGADFSQVAVDINEVISEAQTSLGINTSYNNSGSIIVVEGVEGVQRIIIPDGITKIKPIISVSGLEPSSLNCFDNNNQQISRAPSTAVGYANSLGTQGWYLLPDGTKSVSYTYKNSYLQESQFDMGLAIKWVGQ